MDTGVEPFLMYAQKRYIIGFTPEAQEFSGKAPPLYSSWERRIILYTSRAMGL
jgi:hypothetical protein